jgi:hypothetical protein
LIGPARTVRVLVATKPVDFRYAVQLERGVKAENAVGA